MYNNYSRPTSLGIDERWERVLCYAFWWVSGLILLFIETQNQTVRRHAKQSVIVFGVLSGLLWVTFVFGALLGWIPVIGWIFGGLLGLVHGLLWIIAIVLWILLMVLAYAGPRTIFIGPRQDRML